jgi:hypothetical protein
MTKDTRATSEATHEQQISFPKHELPLDIQIKKQSATKRMIMPTDEKTPV